MTLRILLLLMLVSLSGCQRAPEPLAGYWKDWGDQQLTQWLDNSQALIGGVAGYCAATTEREELQAQWRQVFLQWSAQNGLPYKGIADLALEFELYFWPDKRNRVAGQLQRRINETATITPTTLETRIAAEKGLAALEWLIFIENPDRASRCRLLPAVAADYAAKVEAIAHYHQANPLVLAEWLTSDAAPQQSNSISLNLLFAQVTALESRVKNSIDADQAWLANQAWGWRSDTTLSSFAASIEVLLQHFEFLGARPELAADSRQQVERLISTGQEIRDQLNSGQQVAAGDLLAWLAEAENWLQTSASRDLNVLIGFNNFDGD